MEDIKAITNQTDYLARVTIAVRSEIGDRSEQQDSYGFAFIGNSLVLTVCDGMGGHKGGKAASSLARDTIIQDCKIGLAEANCDIQDLLISTMHKIDREIASLIDDNGSLLNAGSTTVTVIVSNKKLYWCSCGDSRAYLLRNREFVQVTKDQTYKTVLQEQLHAGIISQETYLKQIIDGDALVSYLGIGNISLIDYNQTSLMLFEGDRILVASDGLYKILADSDIRRILLMSTSAEDAVRLLWVSVQNEAKNLDISMDNVTVAVVDVQ